MTRRVWWVPLPPARLTPQASRSILGPCISSLSHSLPVCSFHETPRHPEQHPTPPVGPYAPLVRYEDEFIQPPRPQLQNAKALNTKSFCEVWQRWACAEAMGPRVIWGKPCAVDSNTWKSLHSDLAGLRALQTRERGPAIHETIYDRGCLAEGCPGQPRDVPGPPGRSPGAMYGQAAPWGRGEVQAPQTHRSRLLAGWVTGQRHEIFERVLGVEVGRVADGRVWEVGGGRLGQDGGRGEV